jgi:hypothetical protein
MNSPWKVKLNSTFLAAGDTTSGCRNPTEYPHETSTGFNFTEQIGHLLPFKSE